MNALSHRQPMDYVTALLRARQLLSAARSVEDLAWAVNNNLSVWLQVANWAETLPARGDHAAMARSLSRQAGFVVNATLASGRIAPADGILERFMTLNTIAARKLADSRQG